jgi:hypothetical protein
MPVYVNNLDAHVFLIGEEEGEGGISCRNDCIAL